MFQRSGKVGGAETGVCRNTEFVSLWGYEMFALFGVDQPALMGRCDMLTLQSMIFL